MITLLEKINFVKHDRQTEPFTGPQIAFKIMNDEVIFTHPQLVTMTADHVVSLTNPNQEYSLTEFNRQFVLKKDLDQNTFVKYYFTPLIYIIGCVAACIGIGFLIALLGK